MIGFGSSWWDTLWCPQTWLLGNSRTSHGDFDGKVIKLNGGASGACCGSDDPWKQMVHHFLSFSDFQVQSVRNYQWDPVSKWETYRTLLYFACLAHILSRGNVWNPAGDRIPAKHGGSYPAENLLQELIFHQPIWSSKAPPRGWAKSLQYAVTKPHPMFKMFKVFDQVRTELPRTKRLRVKQDETTWSNMKQHPTQWGPL